MQRPRKGDRELEKGRTSIEYFRSVLGNPLFAEPTVPFFTLEKPESGAWSPAGIRKENLDIDLTGDVLKIIGRRG
jgi:hypothetical protein